MNKVFRSRLVSCAIGFAVALALFGMAPGDVFTAIEANDAPGLEALAKTASGSEARLLAQGAALALRHRDEAAIALLKPLAASAADTQVRASAELALAPVYLRQSRFAEVAAAMERAKSLRKEPFTLDEEQTLDFVKSLIGVEPMTVQKRARGALTVKRDMAGLARIHTQVNGQDIESVVDSGAGFSTVTESTAKKLGLRILDRPTTVGSSTKEKVATRLGVAETLRFGDAVLKNVVFVVLPDEALRFAGGLYTIDAIAGLPLFVALDRIALVKEKGQEILEYGPKPSQGPANMLLAGVEPIILAGSSAGTLRLFLDTGASHTTLNASVASDFPALTADGKKKTARMAGAGGTAEDAEAISLPALSLTLDGKSYVLDDVNMESKTNSGRHGAIGQDLLSQGSGWSLDFAAMHFSIAP